MKGWVGEWVHGDFDTFGFYSTYIDREYFLLFPFRFISFTAMNNLLLLLERKYSFFLRNAAFLTGVHVFIRLIADMVSKIFFFIFFIFYFYFYFESIIHEISQLLHTYEQDLIEIVLLFGKKSPLIHDFLFFPFLTCCVDSP